MQSKNYYPEYLPGGGGSTCIAVGLECVRWHFCLYPSTCVPKPLFSTASLRHKGYVKPCGVTSKSSLKPDSIILNGDTCMTGDTLSYSLPSFIIKKLQQSFNGRFLTKHWMILYVGCHHPMLSPYKCMVRIFGPGQQTVLTNPRPFFHPFGYQVSL